MSYEKYQGYRLAPDSNGCWDVLTDDYEAMGGAYPSKAAAKRAIDELVAEELTHPNPKDPQAELREDLRQIFSGTMVVVQEDDLDRAVKLFQAHQQELLSELLGELPKKKKVNLGDFSYGREMAESYNQGRADIVSVIQSKIGELNG